MGRDRCRFESRGGEGVRGTGRVVSIDLSIRPFFSGGSLGPKGDESTEPLEPMDSSPFEGRSNIEEADEYDGAPDDDRDPSS